jgi:hypothetical protein
MPRLDENITVPAQQPRAKTNQTQPPHPNHHQYSNSYPWSPINHPSERNADDVAYAGYMKKRKTRMLRHEWHEHHFTLKGTRLSMHKDARALETLEYIDVDDYAIACSSLASGSKLNAAFKAMNISRGNKDKKDDAAFAFQLIPAPINKAVRLQKRESASETNGPSEGKDAGAKCKTHYFAVKSRSKAEERGLRGQCQREHDLRARKMKHDWMKNNTTHCRSILFIPFVIFLGF